jgi:hypothetical protein
MSNSLMGTHATAGRTVVGRPPKFSWPSRSRHAHWLVGLSMAALLTGSWFVCLALVFLVSAGRQRVRRSRAVN